MRVRYKQAALGIAWALFQPLAQMVIFTVVFNRFAGIQSDSTVPYSVFCFAGLTVWGLFSSGLSHATDSLLNSSNLVTKVYFPRVVVPLASILTSVVDWAIAFVLLIVLMLINGVPFHAGLILAIPIAGIAALCAAALGMWLSALNLQFRDVRHALPFLIQILVYATPVFYPVDDDPGTVPVPAGAESDGCGGRRLSRGAVRHRDPVLAARDRARRWRSSSASPGFVRFCRLERTFADRI